MSGLGAGQLAAARAAQARSFDRTCVIKRRSAVGTDTGGQKETYTPDPTPVPCRKRQLGQRSMELITTLTSAGKLRGRTPFVVVMGVEHTVAAVDRLELDGQELEVIDPGANQTDQTARRVIVVER